MGAHPNWGAVQTDPQALARELAIERARARRYHVALHNMVAQAAPILYTPVPGAVEPYRAVVVPVEWYEAALAALPLDPDAEDATVGQIHPTIFQALAPLFRGSK